MWNCIRSRWKSAYWTWSYNILSSSCRMHVMKINVEHWQAFGEWFYQRKYNIKEENWRIRLQKMSPSLWFNFYELQRNQFCPPSSPQQLADTCTQRLNIQTISDKFPRAYESLESKLCNIFCRGTLIFPSVTIHVLWLPWNAFLVMENIQRQWIVFMKCIQDCNNPSLVFNVFSFPKVRSSFFFLFPACPD